MSPRYLRTMRWRWPSSLGAARLWPRAVAGAPISLMVACTGGERPLEVPETPPETLSVLVDPNTPSKEADGEGGRARVAFPLTKQSVRRDVCGIPVAVNPVVLMRPGSVETLQRRLVERELLKEANFRRGELDAPTLAALAEAQADAELPVVGIPNYATMLELGLEPTEVFVAGDAACKGGD